MRLTRHVSQKHGLSKEELLKAFPNIELESKEAQKSRSEAAKLHWTEERRELARQSGTRNLVNFNRTQYQRADSAQRREKRSREMSKIANNPQIQQKAAISRTGLVSSTRSATMKEKWKDSDYANKVLSSNCGYRTNLRTYSNGTFRSSWENEVSIILDRLKLNYSYEPFRIQYTINGELHRYTPDFYIESLNLIIEVKPNFRLKDDLTRAKELACRDLGYNYIYATESNIFNGLLESNLR